MPLIDRMIDLAAADETHSFALGPMAEAAQGAQHFVFDREAKVALANLAHGKPSSLLAALQLCKLPFDRCWLEWPGEMVSGMESRQLPSATEEIPRTIGVLLERKERNVTLGSFVFEFPENSDKLKRLTGLRIYVSPCTFAADWSENPDPFITFNSPNFNRVDPEYLQRFAKAESDPAHALAERVIPLRCEYTQQIEDGLRRNGPSYVKPWFEAGARDISGEWFYAQAALCLLNSRSCVAIEAVDLSKLNKARTKARKRPFVSYSTVKITLSKGQRRVADVRGLSGEELRRHVCRGHFKVRKGGIYWWRPHLRGSIKVGEVRRSRYEVTGPHHDR